MPEEIARLTDELREMTAERDELRAALEEIAERGPVSDYNSAGALRLRLVATQSIARAALGKTAPPENPNAGAVAPHGTPKGRWTP